MDLPEALVAQPYAVIAGSVIGASVCTLLILFFSWRFDGHCGRSHRVLYHQPDPRLSPAGGGARDVSFAALSGSMVSADSGPTFYCRHDWLCDAPEQVRSRMAELSVTAEQPSENGIDRTLNLYP